MSDFNEQLKQIQADPTLGILNIKYKSNNSSSAAIAQKFGILSLNFRS